MRLISICAAAAALVLSACSTHPLPENVTRKTTYDLVEKLRCEAREGVMRSKVPPVEYENHILGYDFSFDITENNKIENGSLELGSLIHGGSLKVGLNGGIDKKRENLRFFRIAETFGHLMKTTAESCGTAPGVNPIYPIAGKVGLDEVVTTYGKLGRLTQFKAKDDKDNTVFSDTITFTTQVTAGVSTTVKVDALTSAIKISGATGSQTNTRTDVHKVTIAIAPKAGARFGTNAFLYSSRSAYSATRAGNPAATVIQELDRIRNRDEDLRVLQQLRLAN